MAGKSKARRIEAASPEAGSDFLPALATALSQIHDELVRLTAKTKTILIVEDDRDAREILTAVLGRAGYTTATAKNGKEALRKLKQFSPQLILLDLRMPEMDGWELDRLMKLDPVLRKIPVVVISAFARLESSRSGLDAAAWFQKPIDLRALLDLVPTLCPEERAVSRR